MALGLRLCPRHRLQSGRKTNFGSRQLGPPEGRATNAAVLARQAFPFQAGGSLNPSDMDSDPSFPVVSSERGNRGMSNYMSVPLSDLTNATTENAQMGNTLLLAVERPNNMAIYISGAREIRTFVA